MSKVDMVRCLRIFSLYVKLLARFVATRFGTVQSLFFSVYRLQEEVGGMQSQCDGFCIS